MFVYLQKVSLYSQCQLKCNRKRQLKQYHKSVFNYEKALPKASSGPKC
jgi:hypothetical protein